jgi:hypothetical protein
MFCTRVSGELTLSMYGNAGLLTIHGESSFRAVSYLESAT